MIFFYVNCWEKTELRFERKKEKPQRKPQHCIMNHLTKNKDTATMVGWEKGIIWGGICGVGEGVEEVGDTPLKGYFLVGDYRYEVQ